MFFGGPCPSPTAPPTRIGAPRFFGPPKSCCVAPHPPHRSIPSSGSEVPAFLAATPSPTTTSLARCDAPPSSSSTLLFLAPPRALCPALPRSVIASAPPIRLLDRQPRRRRWLVPEAVHPGSGPLPLAGAGGSLRPPILFRLRTRAHRATSDLPIPALPARP